MNIFVQPVGAVGTPAVPGIRPRAVSLQFGTGRAIYISPADISELRISPLKMYRAILPLQPDNIKK